MSNNVPKHVIQEVSFIGSYPRVSIAPSSGKPEIAFIGRSNVGKSSLINMICGRKKLAKTSSTPGKTQMINLFDVDDRWIIADLPGYGYAKVSKKTRGKWSKMITDYLLEREDLVTVFVLVDARVKPQESDLEKIVWLGQKQIPFGIIFTKVEKLKNTELGNNVDTYIAHLQEHFDPLPNYFITSAKTKTGGQELLDYIEYILDSVN